MPACYRHPDRDTNVGCSNCGRSICPDCMTTTPVGMRCPECARERTKVHSGPVGLGSGAAPVTFAMMGACILAFLGQALGGGGFVGGGLGSVGLDGALLGFGAVGTDLIGVAEGEWYRIVTGGFLHSGILHLGLNMFALYFLGTLIEPAIGPWRFAGIYLVSLLGGSFGALLLEPLTLTVGASGAVFGLMAAGYLIARDRGFDAIASQIGLYVVLNLAFTFSIPNISIGGHIGGLLAGGGVTLAILAARQRRGREGRGLELAAVVGLALVAVVGCIVAADASIPSRFG